MKKTFEEIVNAPLLENEKLIRFSIDSEIHDGKIVGLSNNGLVKIYIVECLDDTFPNEIYPYKFITLPLSEIIY